jgi:hypothetical protein
MLPLNDLRADVSWFARALRNPGFTALRLQRWRS